MINKFYRYGGVFMFLNKIYQGKIYMKINMKKKILANL